MRNEITLAEELERLKAERVRHLTNYQTFTRAAITGGDHFVVMADAEKLQAQRTEKLIKNIEGLLV